MPLRGCASFFRCVKMGDEASQMSCRLAPSPDDLRAYAAAAAGFLAEYYEGLERRPVLRSCTFGQLRELLDEPLPLQGCDFGPLLAAFRENIVEYARHNAHPRFFGYISSPGTPVAALAELLAATLNANVTSWRSSPSAAQLEHVAIGWLKEMFGLPASSGGVFVSGGSIANFSALAAARAARGPASTGSAGIRPGDPIMRIYASGQSHFSIAKAASLLGIGEANVVTVRTDSAFRLDLEHLRDLVQADRAAGHLPLCVAACAGSVSTGAIDPLAEVGGIARQHGLWFHVDAAYGGMAILAPSARPLLQGIELADSITVDPHKWAYLPTGAGCVLWRDPAAAQRAFSHQADYTRVLGHAPDESFAFWDYSPELSRPFRALPFWFLFKFAGAQAIGEAIERNIECARHLEAIVRRSEDFEMLAPAGLSVFCFRYRPRTPAADLDALNRQILVQLQRDGSSYLSNATINGRFALRGCVVNHATTLRDMEILVEDVRRAARAVMA